MSRMYLIRDLQRNRSQSNINYVNLKREKGWDNRFIYNKIPDYCAFNDKNYLNIKYFNEQAKRTTINDPFYRTNKSFFRNLNRSNITTSNYSIGNNHIQDNMEPCDRIMILWNDLGVLDNYRELFAVVANQLDDQSRRDFYNLEIKTLTNLFDDLGVLNQTINARETSVSNLQKLNEKLSSVLKETSPKSNEKQFNTIINEIQNIRANTIQVVNQMNKIRNNYSYSILGGKFNMELLEKKFSFDKNYLIKMKEEMMFLKYGYIKYFFNINENVDPFMLSASIDTGDPLQQKVPINQETHDKIKLAQYLIMQDLIFYQTQNFKAHTIRTISPIKRRINPMMVSSKGFINANNNSNKGYKTANNFFRGNGLVSNMSTPCLKEEPKSSRILESTNEHSDYTLNILNSSLNQDFENRYEKFLEKLPYYQKQIFNIKHFVKEYIEGSYPCIIYVTNKNDVMCGFCAITYECESSLILKISNLTTNLDNKNTKYVLNKIIKYIKKEFDYDELHICMNKNYDKETISNEYIFFIDVFINLGFAYYNETMLLVYKNTKKVSQNIKDKYIFQNKNLFSIANAVIMKNNPNQNDIITQREPNKMNIYMITSLTSNEKCCEIFDKIYTTKTSLDEIKNYLLSNKINISSPLLDTNVTIKYSFLTNIDKLICYSNRYSYLLEDGIYYNYIYAQCKTITIDDINFDLYIYQANIENDYQYIICEMNDSIKEKYNNSLYREFNKLYKDFLANNKEKNEKLKVIWIPCFEYLGHFIMNGESNEDVREEYVKILFDKSVRKEENNENQKYLKIVPEKDDVVIKKDFIFGIVSKEGYIIKGFIDENKDENVWKKEEKKNEEKTNTELQMENKDENILEMFEDRIKYNPAKENQVEQKMDENKEENKKLIKSENNQENIDEEKKENKEEEVKEEEKIKEEVQEEEKIEGVKNEEKENDKKKQKEESQLSPKNINKDIDTANDKIYPIFVCAITTKNFLKKE